MAKKNVAVLVSGGGTNLQALIDYQLKIGDRGEYQIVVVISDHKDAYALERAKKVGIPSCITSPYAVMGKENAQAASIEEKRIAVSDAVLKICKEKEVDIIVQAGWLTVLAGQIIDDYSDRIINLHPALLPKFGGVGMWGHHVHEAVINAKESESGCTIHLVNKECDGGRILIQKRVPVLPDDTPDSLYARIAPEEHKAIVEGLLMLCSH